MPRDVCLDVAIPILPAIQNWKQTQTIINLDWSWKIICYRFNWIIICLSIMADSPQAHVCCCGHGFLCICPFLMLVTTSIFTFKGDFLSNFVLILIILNLSLWVLYYIVKNWTDHFWTTVGCSFTCYKRKFNLLKSSLWIWHLKMIKMYRTLNRKSPFSSAATWWSSTLESGEYIYTL